jgi:iron(II)-dependent oxidoreductase
MWQLERFGAILAGKEQWRQHAQQKAAIDFAVRAIDDRFALVPEGYVTLPQTTGAQPGGAEEALDTAPFLIQRLTVSNAAFQMFVDDGGYENLEFWPKEIWPHIIDFRDQTRQSGPRYWRNGRHNRRLCDHPVVGVCYFEAAAYALWAGFRLPTEAEWQMAASWRIRSPADVLRRYPWGDAFDVRCCNIWASGVGGTLPVTAYELGAAPNGVLQLVGNVWEWTESDFQITDDEGHPLVGDTVMKGVRGGAFDTYFPAQTASSFRTGLAGLSRMHNVGFRCALDLSASGA